MQISLVAEMSSYQQQRKRSSLESIRQSLTRRFDELRTSLAFFTRLPVALRRPLLPADSTKLFQNSFWAAPIAGLIVGLIALVGAWTVNALSLPALSAVLALSVATAITGGLHEDGLADLADACGGGSKAQRLEIMKDSRVGSFGVCALILWFLAAFICLEALAAAKVLMPVLVWTAIVSRGLLPTALRLIPSGSTNGIAQQAKGTSWLTVAFAMIFCGLSTAVTGYWLALMVVVIAQLCLYLLAWRLIGGATGDVFGAAQKIGELAGYLALVGMVSQGTIA